MSRGWRLFRVANSNEVFVYDGESEYLARVPLRLAEQAAAQVGSASVSLQHALRATAPAVPIQVPAYPHSLSLELLGACLLVRCRHAVCLDGIRRQFSAAVGTVFSTPDVIVDCEWEQADRHLFRARPSSSAGQPLLGVAIMLPGSERSRPWRFASPPLPPLAVPPFRDRFVGLHAAAVVLPEGGAVVLAGERGTGKSTAALSLVNEFGCSLLTDETVFIHRRTILVEPFAQAIGVWQAGKKVTVAAVDVCERIVDVSAPIIGVMVLDRQADTKPGLRPISPAGALRELLRHHLDVGATADEAMVTLVRLAQSVPALRFHWAEPAQLYDAVSDIFNAFVPPGNSWSL